jgi:putative ABC transport system ATP-binding protein
MAGENSIIFLEKINKVFNRGTQDEKCALDDLTLEVNAGDFITVIGSNGAGKTTMLNVISGTHQPDSGRLVICGDDVTKAEEHEMAKYLARVFQDPTMGTAANMTIEENMALAEMRGQRRGLRMGVTRDRRRRYSEVLEILGLGLEDRLKDKVGLLSGGQRQSLALLMTTLSSPKLLLLDEHTAALDPKTADKVMQLTLKMIEENQLTTLMITHNMHQALTHGNRMIMLHQGHVQLDVAGQAKEKMTVAEVIDTFGRTLKDETLFTAGEC